jgi:pimeloyl-ACP methyl ester carboxylesterase
MKIPSPTVKDVITTGRFEIPYRLYDNDGPHLICLNGIQQSMAMWQGFVARFAPDYRIVLFNFPAQGNGRALSGPTRASLKEEVEILYDVMKKTGVNQDVSFCTASWGGVIALAFAAQHPYAVKRLLLGSIGTRPNQKMIEIIQEGLSIGTDNREQFAEHLIQSFGENLPESIKKKIGAQFRTLSEANLQAFCEHGLKVISAQKLSDHINFKNIAVETIVIRGEDDVIVDLEDVMFLSSQIPNCKLKVIKNVGHFLHLESDVALDVYQELLSNGTKHADNAVMAQC